MAAAYTNLTIDDIKYFILDKGGRVTNHELVSHFRNVLNDPRFKDIARQRFKDYVNTLATVKQIDGVKYLILKSEHQDEVDNPYFVNSPYTDTSSPLMSPMTFRSPSSSFHEEHNSHDTSLPPMAQLPTRTLFQEVCQAVQQNNNVPHSQSSPANLNRYNNQHEAYSPSPVLQNRMPHIPDESVVNRNYVNHVESSNVPSSYAQNYAPEEYPYQGNRMIPEPSFVQSPAENVSLPSSNIQQTQDFLPNPPPRRKSLNAKLGEEEAKTSNAQNSPDLEKSNLNKENIPVTKDKTSEVLSPISVRERAQKLNKIVSETELNFAKNKRYDRLPAKGADDDDAASVSSLDPLHRQWTIASAKCDYHALLRLLKVESKLARARDYISGYTALHWGAKHGNCDIIKLIAGRHGLNPNVRSNGGYTPLHLAAMHGHEEVMDLLIDTYGADCNIRDYGGKKPRQYMENIETTVSEQVRKICTEAQNRRNAEKETPSFLRIGSLNVKVQKTISSISLKNSQRKSWGSADNLQELLARQQMPAPKFVPVKRNKSKKMHRYSNYLDVKSDQNPSNEMMSQVKVQQRAQRRSSFHNS